MRRTLAALAACALSAPLLSSCAALFPGATVGDVVVSWDEGSDGLEGFDKRSPTFLISSEAQWQEWLASLPGEMREARAEEISRVDLDDSVLLVAVWPRCTEVGSVLDEGRGAVRFEIDDPEPNTVCAWSPTQVQVWDLPLSQLGVERAEVHLVP